MAWFGVVGVAWFGVVGVLWFGVVGVVRLKNSGDAQRMNGPRTMAAFENDDNNENS